MKKRILLILISLMIVILPQGIAHAEDSYGEISIKIDDEWNFQDVEEFTRIDEYSGYITAKEFFDEMTTADLVFIKDDFAPDDESLKYTTADEAKNFFDCYAKYVIADYYESWFEWEQGEAAENMDFFPCGCIKTKEGYFLKVRAEYHSDHGMRYVYIRHSDDGIYHMFVTSAFYDIHSKSERDRVDKSTKDFEEQISTFEDISYDNAVAEAVADVGIIDRLDHWAMNKYGRDIDFATVILGIIFILAALLFVVRAFLPDKKDKKTTGGRKKIVKDIAPVKRSSGDRKKEKKTVDGLERTTVHCTYEDSLKSLLDSGLLTRKEYREMLEKHYR